MHALFFGFLACSVTLKAALFFGFLEEFATAVASCFFVRAVFFFLGSWIVIAANSFDGGVDPSFAVIASSLRPRT